MDIIEQEPTAQQTRPPDISTTHRTVEVTALVGPVRRPNAGGNDASGDAAHPSTVRRLLVALGSALLIWSIFSLGMWFQAHSSAPRPAGPFTSSNNSSSNPPLLVHVTGQVQHPGVYKVPFDARLGDAIQQAGGATAQGDINAINLAAWVEDGSRIDVPAKTPTPTPIAIEKPSVTVEAIAPSNVPAPAPKSKRPAVPVRIISRSSPVIPVRSVALTSKIPMGSHKTPIEELTKHPININTATAEKLQQLPGVGPVMADKILAYRQQSGGFKSVDDLRNVSGIGEKRMATLRPLVTVS